MSIIRYSPAFFKLAFFLVSALIFTIHSVYSKANRIFMDGKFSDWQDLTPIYTDQLGDQLTGDLDFGKLWVTNDEQFFFLRIEVGVEIIFQQDTCSTLYLDTDDNALTGMPIHEIGAELAWNFGQRFGLFWDGTKTDTIYQSQIGIVTSPTISSTQFEISFDRNAQPRWQTPLFQGNTVRILFEDRGPGRDLLPDSGNGVSYTFDESTVLPPLMPISLSKQDSSHLRILSYNVHRDSLFNPNHFARFTRILQAINPDIIGFQEIYDHDAQQTVNLIESLLPSLGQQQWYGSKIGYDNIAISRYPILNSFPITGCLASRYNGAFIINLRPVFDTQLLFIVAHPPCCDYNIARQYEIDAIMAFIRDARARGGAIDLEPNTPILIVGDMNLVGYSQQLTTFLTGEILNTAQFGPPFSPDWDGTDFADLMPRHTDLPMFYTWRSDFESFSPGRLDYMIFSDSMLKPANNFVLFTPAMSLDSLNLYNLQAQDVMLASDHLPVVADFILKIDNSVQTKDYNIPMEYTLMQNYPNPFNLSTTIKYKLQKTSKIIICIYNLQGQKIKTLLNSLQTSGEHFINWDGRDDQGKTVGSGIYIYTFKKGDMVLTSKMVYLK